MVNNIIGAIFTHLFSSTLFALLLAHSATTGCHGNPVERSQFVDLQEDWMRRAKMAPVGSELLAVPQLGLMPF